MANVSESFRTKHNSFGELKIFAKPLLRKPTLFNEKDTLHPTDTTWAEESIWDIMAGLNEGHAKYGPKELRELFGIGYRPAFFEANEMLSSNLLAKKATYVLPRFVEKKDISLLADAEIHFTDNANDFYQQIDNITDQTFIPGKRARVYRKDIDKNGRTHITFLLKHSNKENYIDAFELVSFLSFIEFFKDRINNSEFEDQGHAGTELVKDLRTLGFNDIDSIKRWAKTERQVLSLSYSPNFSLNSPWNTYGQLDVKRPGKLWEHDKDVLSDAVWMINRKIKKIKEKVPDYVIFGNDFSMPLMATLGLFDQEDIEKVYELASPEKAQPGEPTIDKKEIEDEIKKIPDPIDRETIRKFRVYQFLNIYEGKNSVLRGMRRTLDTTVDSVRKRVVSAGETGLGSPVDIIDFGGLNVNLIAQIKQPKIKELLLNLHKKKAKILSIAYPLGENIGPLVRLFYKELGIKNIGFFGKVGSLVDKNGDGGIKRGRVVMPEFYSREGEKVIKKFINLLEHNRDAFLIKEADFIEVIGSTNSVLLETGQDAEIIKNLGEEKVKAPRVLLDSEAFFLQEECLKLGIIPVIIYYISDNTTLDGRPYRDMTHALGAEGTLAALESPLIILNKWFGYVNLVTMLRKFFLKK